MGVLVVVVLTGLTVVMGADVLATNTNAPAKLVAAELPATTAEVIGEAVVLRFQIWEVPAWDKFHEILLNAPEKLPDLVPDEILESDKPVIAVGNMVDPSGIALLAACWTPKFNGPPVTLEKLVWP